VSPIRSDMTAAEYLVSTVASAPGTITVVTLGPLSNIGAAIRLSSAFAPAVKRLVMMGGDTLGTGNKAPGGAAAIHDSLFFS
jgi:purine nucleosidase